MVTVNNSRKGRGVENNPRNEQSTLISSFVKSCAIFKII